MMAPTVTTILTTFRRPALLSRAIRSVLAQEYKDIRVLVLDDASNDETERVVDAIRHVDPRVIYVRHSVNIGMTPNWRYGLDHVETPYFSFLSDDDLQLPGFYAAAVKVLELNQDVAFYCGATISFNTQGVINAVSTDGWEEGVYRPPTGMVAMLNGPISWNGIVFRRSVRDRVGTLANIHSTDYEFLVRSARQMPFFVSHEPAAMFQHHGGRLAWKPALDQVRLFHEFFPLGAGIISSPGMTPEMQAQVWPAMNALGFSAGKYLFLYYASTGQAKNAIQMAQYLKRFAPGSLKAWQFVVIAKCIQVLPSLSRILAYRLAHPAQIRGRRQRRWQKRYGAWIKYAAQLATVAGSEA